LAEKREAEARDKIWRENFRPHAIILTERTVPSPIFVAAIIGVEKLLRIDLDATQGPVSFVRQALDRLPEGVPAFGKTVGFAINYSPDKAVRFDRNGQPIAILDKAVRLRTAVLRLGGRQPRHVSPIPILDLDNGLALGCVEDLDCGVQQTRVCSTGGKTAQNSFSLLEDCQTTHS
jgi:hypothetical protein